MRWPALRAGRLRRDRGRPSRFSRWRAAAVLGFGMLIVVGVLVSGAQQAWAQDWNVPFFGDCPKQAPLPAFPGEGLIGSIDPPSPDQGAPGSVYHMVSYAGTTWHTYGLGSEPICNVDIASDPWAVVTTGLGNALLWLAKLSVAVTVWFSESVTDTGLLAQLDRLVVSLANTLYQGVAAEFGSAVLAVLAVIILWLALRGDMPAVSQRSVAALAGMAVAASAYLSPLIYINLINNGVSDLTNQTRNSVLRAANVDGVSTLSQTLYREVVWENWVQGEFGSTVSPDAEQYAVPLVQTQAFTREEVQSGNTGQEAVDAKQERFNQIAEDLSATSKRHFTGRSGSRLIWGAWALFEANAYGLFQWIANLVEFVCLTLLRVLVFLAPVLGLIAVIRNRTLVEILNAAGTAVWHALYLTIAAAVNLIAMVYISGLNITLVGQAVLVVLLTVGMWMVVGPIARLRSMFNATAAVAGMDKLTGKAANKIDLDLPKQRGSGGDSGEERHRRDEPSGPVPERPEGRSNAPAPAQPDGRQPVPSQHVSSQPRPEGQGVPTQPEPVGAGAASGGAASGGSAAGAAGTVYSAVQVYRNGHQNGHGSLGGQGGAAGDGAAPSGSGRTEVIDMDQYRERRSGSQPVYRPGRSAAADEPQARPEARDYYRPPGGER